MGWGMWELESGSKMLSYTNLSSHKSALFSCPQLFSTHYCHIGRRLCHEEYKYISHPGDELSDDLDNDNFFLLLLQFWQVYWSYDLQIVSIYIWMMNEVDHLNEAIASMTDHPATRHAGVKTPSPNLYKPPTRFTVVKLEPLQASEKIFRWSKRSQACNGLPQALMGVCTNSEEKNVRVRPQCPWLLFCTHWWPTRHHCGWDSGAVSYLWQQANAIPFACTRNTSSEPSIVAPSMLCYLRYCKSYLQ